MIDIVVDPESGFKSKVSDVVLKETSTTRLVIRPAIVRNAATPEAGFHFDFVHQKKAKSGTWDDAPRLNLGKLSAGEEVGIHLDAAQTQELYHQLTLLKEVQEKAKNPWNYRKFVVLEAGETAGLNEEALSRLLKNIIASGRAKEIFDNLARSSPDELTRLSLLRVAHERERALKEFELMLDSDLPEGDWQKFFKANTWIFGYGLCYRFINTLGTEVQYRAQDVTRRSSQRGDFLMGTAGDVRFTVLVEIKRPNTRLLASERYRNGAWTLHGDLIGGVSQVQANCASWLITESRSDTNRELLERKQGVYTCEPKGILVIGRSSECEGVEKRNTFEAFRRNLTTPEIITFDELFERAKFIVSEKSDMPENAPEALLHEEEPEDDDIPF